MGYITQFVVGGVVILAVLFVFSILFTEGATHGGYTNQMQFNTFNKTNDYGNYLSNQTETFKSQMEAVQDSGANPFGIAQVASLFFNIGTTAVVSMFSLLGIGIAVIMDIGVYAGIPVFFLGLVMVVLIYRFAAQALQGWKKGDL